MSDAVKWLQAAAAVFLGETRTFSEGVAHSSATFDELKAGALSAMLSDIKCILAAHGEMVKAIIAKDSLDTTDSTAIRRVQLLQYATAI
jgi:hypothetical protein